MLKQIFFFLVLFGLVSCQSSSGGESSPAEETTPISRPDRTEEQNFLDLLNAERRKQGLKEVKLHSGLSDIARIHSINMESRTVSFGHSGFNERCSEGRKVIGGGNLCSENVAMGQKNIETVFSSWMNSSGHRDNMLNSRITHVGLGISPVKGGTLYWTLLLLEKK